MDLALFSHFAFSPTLDLERVQRVVKDFTQLFLQRKVFIVKANQKPLQEIYTQLVAVVSYQPTSQCVSASEVTRPFCSLMIIGPFSYSLAEKNASMEVTDLRMCLLLLSFLLLVAGTLYPA